MTMPNLVDYKIASESSLLTFSLEDGKLFTYVLTAKGVYVYGENKYFAALIPVHGISSPTEALRGLRTLRPYVILKDHPRISAEILSWALAYSRRPMPNELLFEFMAYQAGEKGWLPRIPPQVNGPTFVRPLDSVYAPVELHSHNVMDAFFSAQDNADETGFRIYCVLGRIDQEPAEIKVRISIYGHRAIIPYETIFEPIDEVRDAA